jgi:membrane protein
MQSEQTRIQSFKHILSLIRHVRQRYVSDGCGNSAAALTYMSLFAVVPLITVMYAMLSAVPATEEVGLQVQEFIFDNFVPSTGQEIQVYLEQFAQQARRLTGVGIAFLAATALLMLKNIEKTFNAIWKTRENRHGLSSFLLYWAILSLGPLFIGLAFGISTYLATLKVLFDQVDIIGIGPQLLRLTPYFLTTAAFTLIFVAIPNCKVPLKHAFIGGLITAFAFEMAKQIFAGVVSNTSYQHIYGTFATIPLFLLWIYMSWLLILAGAELVHALSGFHDYNEDDYSDITLSLCVLERLWSLHQRGLMLAELDILNKPWLFGRHSISANRWTLLRNQLIKGGLLQISQSGEFILGRDLNTFTLWDLTVLLGKNSFAQHSTQESLPNWYKRCQQTIAEVEVQNQRTLASPLAALFTD